MRALVPVLAVVVILSGGCSTGDATSNVGTLDAPALQACSQVQALVQARSARAMAPRDLRTKVAQIYAAAGTSANPIIRAKAVALFADATQLASGGESSSLESDLTSLSQTCAGQLG
jgi:hypothetical protein